VVAKVASVFSPAFATVPALAKKLSAPTYPRHPDGIILDIFGTNRRDCGRSCEEHGCCGEILTEDVVVRLRREQILVPNKLGRKGSMREETAITVNWVTDGVDRCRVGFLPKSYVATGSVYDGVLCQIVHVGSILSTDKAEAKKFHDKCGFALASVLRTKKKFHVFFSKISSYGSTLKLPYATHLGTETPLPRQFCQTPS
jgi:hypothetical protein